MRHNVREMGCQEEKREQVEISEVKWLRTSQNQ